MVIYYHVLEWEGKGIGFAQNTTQTLIGDQLKTTPAFINVLAGQRCNVNKPIVRLTLGKIIVKRFVGKFVFV